MPRVRQIHTSEPPLMSDCLKQTHNTRTYAAWHARIDFGANVTTENGIRLALPLPQNQSKQESRNVPINTSPGGARWSEETRLLQHVRKTFYEEAYDMTRARSSESFGNPNSAFPRLVEFAAKTKTQRHKKQTLSISSNFTHRGCFSMLHLSYWANNNALRDESKVPRSRG